MKGEKKCKEKKLGNYANLQAFSMKGYVHVKLSIDELSVIL